MPSLIPILESWAALPCVQPSRFDRDVHRLSSTEMFSSTPDTFCSVGRNVKGEAYLKPLVFISGKNLQQKLKTFFHSIVRVYIFFMPE